MLSFPALSFPAPPLFHLLGCSYLSQALLVKSNLLIQLADAQFFLIFFFHTLGNQLLQNILKLCDSVIILIGKTENRVCSFIVRLVRLNDLLCNVLLKPFLYFLSLYGFSQLNLLSIPYFSAGHFLHRTLCIFFSCIFQKPCLTFGRSWSILINMRDQFPYGI